MVSITLHRSGTQPVGFTVSGHADYSEEGSDIVCAAVTASVRLCDAIIAEATGTEAESAVDNDSATVTLRCGDERAIHVFEGFAVLMKELAQEYPDNIVFKEDEANA